jgi:hypothetical protein
VHQGILVIVPIIIVISSWWLSLKKALRGVPARAIGEGNNPYFDAPLNIKKTIRLSIK